MGKVKALYMDIQETAWRLLEANPSESFENLVGLVASEVRQEPSFVQSVVQEVWDEYKMAPEAHTEAHIDLFCLQELNR
jgi:hypothetical protein